MRFFSSSALPSAEKLRFAASCSAAETMSGLSPARRFRLSCPCQGYSADAVHYLGPGFDKSIVLCADWPLRMRAMTQMLRRLAFVLFGRREDLHRAARLLDRRDRGFRGTMDL